MDDSKATKPPSSDDFNIDREEAKEEEYDYLIEGNSEQENANNAQFYHVMDEMN